MSCLSLAALDVARIEVLVRLVLCLDCHMTLISSSSKEENTRNPKDRDDHKTDPSLTLVSWCFVRLRLRAFLVRHIPLSCQKLEEPFAEVEQPVQHAVCELPCLHQQGGRVRTTDHEYTNTDAREIEPAARSSCLPFSANSRKSSSGSTYAPRSALIPIPTAMMKEPMRQSQRSWGRRAERHLRGDRRRSCRRT